MRVSGPGTIDVLRRVGAEIDHTTAAGAMRMRLRLDGARTNEASANEANKLEKSKLEKSVAALACLLVLWREPRSYTGEDSAELLVPGNPLLIRRVLDALLVDEDGLRVRLAGPGEFSTRAFAAGKLTLEQAEGVAATIAARNQDELDAARELISGRTSERYHELAESIATLAALVEAGIDFTDQEDVVPIAPGELARLLDEATAELARELGSLAGREARTLRPLAVLVGVPNAGKSTLMNALLGRRRSVVSDLAGTTRDAVIEPLEVVSDSGGRITIDLADVAGIEGLHGSPDSSHGMNGGASGCTFGEERNSAIQQTIDLDTYIDLDLDLDIDIDIDEQSRARAIETARRADILIWCDPTGRFEAAWLEPVLKAADNVNARNGGLPVVVRVRTRADQWIQEAGARVDSGDVGDDVLAVCAIDGWNVRALAQKLAGVLTRDSREKVEVGEYARSRPLPVALVSHRHAEALTRVHAALARARQATDAHKRSLATPEVVASHLRDALNAMGELTGRIDPDDVIGRVFSRFCVGK